MKRFVVCSIMAIMMTSSVLADAITVKLNGSEVKFSSQEAAIVEGRTLIPLRGVFETLGYEISWDGDTKTATFNNGTSIIEVTANRGSFVMNGEELALDVPAQILNGSMMLPLRAVGEAAGLEVEWDGASKTVNLTGGVQTTAETTVETTTEETTQAETETAVAAKKSDEKLETEAEKAAVLAVLMMYGQCFDATNDKIDETRTKLWSDSNSTWRKQSQFINNAVKIYENYKIYIAKISDNKECKAVVDSFYNIADAYANYYKFLIEYNSTSDDNKYAKMPTQEINNAFDEVIKAIDNAYTEYDIEFDELNDSAGDIAIADSSYAEYFYEEKELSAEERMVVREYKKEIASAVNPAFDYFRPDDVEFDKVFDEDRLRSMANTIRTKINETNAPQRCLLNRAVLYKACDLLDKTADDVKLGAKDEDVRDALRADAISNFRGALILFYETLTGSFDPKGLFSDELIEDYNEMFGIDEEGDIYL